MKILGLSFNYHDASAAILVNGEVVAASAEERFSRQKHDPTFPKNSARYCLKMAGIEGHELDYVAFHEDTATKLTRTLSSSLARWPRSLPSFLKTARDFVTGGSWIQNSISKELGIDPTRILFIPHHMSHAAHAFYGSGFTEAAVMTIDAVGEWTSSAIFRGVNTGGRPRIEPLSVSAFPNSLGLTYSAFTSYLGFKVNDGECSTMALAAFGRPTYLEQVRKIVRVREDGGHDIDLSYFDFRSDNELPVNKKFLDVFGPPRSHKKHLGFDSLSSSQNPTPDDQRFADVACSLQAVVEEAVIAYARKASSLTQLPRLCYAGGVALNCVANSKLIASGTFKEVFIPPDPGDGGGAMGAALYAQSVVGKVAPKARLSPYLGAAFPDDDLKLLRPHINPSRWHHFTLMKNRPLQRDHLHWENFESDEALCTAASRMIAEGKTVGWVQGRSENGPRALGNRSILIRPDNVELARKLSTRVKARAPFRPYALSLSEKEAGASLEMTEAQISSSSRWMQGALSVKPEKRAALRAALHIDGTTRAQIVDQEDNPLFSLLLRKLGEHTGVEAVLNTSFNESGFPIVGTPIDALATFARTDLDVLISGRLIVEKRRP